MVKPLTDAEVADLLRVRRDQPKGNPGFLLDRALATIAQRDAEIKRLRIALEERDR
jgi:hypothetical protein